MILTPEDPRQMEISCRAELVSDEPLVQAIEQVVSRLDLSVLYSRYSEAGRSFFDPSMQLKVLFFSYCDGARSCRAIAKHIRYDIRYRYFCGSLRPDFRTINRFRHDHLDLLPCYFAEMLLLFRELGLLDTSQLALDSTKIRALSSASKRSRVKRLDNLTVEFRRQLEEDVADDELEDADVETEVSRGDSSESEGQEEVKYEGHSDPDARFMKTNEGGKRLSYNSHVVVDKNQVIVATDVSNNADDSVHFGAMLEQTEKLLGEKPERLLADGGYYSGRNISKTIDNGIDLYLPVSKSGGKVPDSRFHRDAFVYDSDSDSYLCPQGQYLHHQTTRRRRGNLMRTYSGRASSCGACPCRQQCTNGRVRKLEISEHYEHERQMRGKLATPAGRAVYRQRQGQVEPVFGNIKFNLGFTRFLLRRLSKVRGEFILFCIAHNLRKLATRLAFPPTRKLIMLLIRVSSDLYQAIYAYFAFRTHQSRFQPLPAK